MPYTIDYYNEGVQASVLALPPTLLARCLARHCLAARLNARCATPGRTGETRSSWHRGAN